MSYGLAYTPYNTNLFLNNSSGNAFDPDAQAFITAANITDVTQQTAVNLLVIGLKDDGIWGKMKAIYPFVGGSAFSHKFNLKDPRDLDIAFRLFFGGGWTHSATGAKPNGLNAYANTFIKPIIHLVDYGSASYYSRTDTPENGTSDVNGCVIGVRSDNTTVNNAFALKVKTNPNNYTDFLYTRTGSNTNNLGRGVDAVGTGFFLGNLNATDSKVYKNGNNFTTISASYTRTTPNLAMYIGALNNKGVTAEFSLKESAFAHIGDTLTQQEIVDLYSRVQHFQEDLSRQV